MIALLLSAGIWTAIAPMENDSLPKVKVLDEIEITGEGAS